MLQAGNHRPTEVVVVDRDERDAPTCPSTSSSSATAPPTRTRWRTSSTRSPKGTPVRTSIEDGVEGARAGRCGDDVMARKAHRRALTWPACQRPSASASSASAAWAGAMRENLAQRVPGASLVAACSPIGEELAWARDALGVTGLHKDYAELLARDRTSTPCSSSRRARCTRRRSSPRCAPASTCSARSRCRWTSTSAPRWRPRRRSTRT